MNFGLPKTKDVVPGDGIWQDLKFVGCSNAIWNFAIL
jgi:hypothetical protein